MYTSRELTVSAATSIVWLLDLTITSSLHASRH